MLDLLELEQLAAFAEYGTLSKAAQELHISQPTLTRIRCSRFERIMRGFTPLQ